MQWQSVKYTTPSGKEVTLYYIGYFAKEVKRTSACIRYWERNHYIPETPFRDKNGRRMYTQEQIDVVKKFLLKYLITNGANILNTNFCKNVFNHWNRLKEEYIRKE